jgi:ABC-type uncharacterized transport system permease subunit
VKEVLRLKEEHLLLHLSAHHLELQRQVLLLHQDLRLYVAHVQRNPLTVEITFGILVIPPTSTTSLNFCSFKPSILSELFYMVQL